MSQARKGGLGRGLAALIPTGPATAPGLGSAAADVVIGVDKRNPSPPPPTKAAPKTPKATKATAAKAPVEAEPETELE
ncbi:chromosome partitioning protein, partial [Rhodococcus erythropolis]|nr:chromosome partitioning protein [Rhodococcus erythropolis]